MERRKFKFLVTENKIGMAKKILDTLILRQMNILKMEIDPPYISIELEGDEKSWSGFNSWIKEEIREILHIVQLDLLDFERRAQELQMVINNMSCGVIAVGKEGAILYYNNKATDLFSIEEKDIDSSINDIIPKDLYNPKTDKEDRDGIDFSQQIRGKEVNLIIDIRLVKDQEGKKTGALLILREMEEIRKLVQSISRASMNTFEDIIGESEAIKNTKLLAKSVAATETNIMILGESGTGKELFARAIHLSSPRKNGPFEAVNCSAVPESLIESEFFGYEKGAFTGANKSGKQGLFELAIGGTIFLDEIGDLPIHLQAKILRAIQEKSIRRIGGGKEIPIDVRIVSATHRNLEKMVREGTFREDLYYRLNVVPVRIAPLRERKEDIPLLAEFFIKMLGENMGKEHVRIPDKALEDLVNYNWPGNVREMQNVIERALILSKDEINFSDQILQSKPQIIKENNKAVDNNSPKFPIELPKVIAAIECKYIREAIKEFHSSREIGRALGISHTSVRNKIKTYNIDCKTYLQSSVK